MKKVNLFLIGLVFLSATFAFYSSGMPYLARGKLACSSNNQFAEDTKTVVTPSQDKTINDSGTVHYLKEDFNGYIQNSKVIDQFDSLNNFQLAGAFSDEKLSTDRYSGQYSLSLQILPDSENHTLTIRKELDRPLDLSRWKDSGTLSLWTKVGDRKGITGIGLKIGDRENNYREYNEITNLQVDIPNNYDSDDVYPDVPLPDDSVGPKKWTDYWLNKGWNYLFWKTDKSHYAENGNFDIGNVAWFEITLNKNSNLSKQEILFDDFRIQDGIQKERNSLGIDWYPPDNEPQNGIFDLDKVSTNKYAAKLLNVRQTQYPTNGDHGRMVLNYGTPVNFSLRSRFMLTNFPKSKEERVNTWFRLAYDFDSSYDPGHDWFGTFISFEWSKFGLTTVIPIEKDYIQDWEPRNENVIGSSVNFVPQENTLYEIHLTVRGQKAAASIYEVRDNCLALRGQTSYEFQRPRYGDNVRYPFCLEVTGNVKAYIYELEIKEL